MTKRLATRGVLSLYVIFSLQPRQSTAPGVVSCRKDPQPSQLRHSAG